MKYVINFIACLPALAIGISLFIMFMLSFDYTWLIIPCIFQSLGLIFLADNTKNISMNLYKLFLILKT